MISSRTTKAELVVCHLDCSLDCIDLFRFFVFIYYMDLNKNHVKEVVFPLVCCLLFPTALTEEQNLCSGGALTSNTLVLLF